MFAKITIKKKSGNFIYDTLIYIGIVISNIILAGIYYFLKRPKRKGCNVEYTTALNYLIIGEKKKALEKLREAVRLNTGNIDAYIKIGDVLRELDRLIVPQKFIVD